MSSGLSTPSLAWYRVQQSQQPKQANLEYLGSEPYDLNSGEEVTPELYFSEHLFMMTPLIVTPWVIIGTSFLLTNIYETALY